MASSNSASASPLYTPLDPLKSEIRLLKLSPDALSIVSCRLSISSLLERPKYRALSYVWGDPKVTETILVNGQNFAATTNLASALRSARDHALDDTIILWADAICINQNDLDEKSHQVQLMGDIYRQASIVLSWLGCDPQISLALRTINLVSEQMGPLSEFHNQRDLEWMRGYPHLYQEDDKSPDFNKAWSAIQVLFKSSYWQRAWIMQEVVLASRLLVQSGDKDIEFQEIFKVSLLLKFKFESKPDFISHNTWAFLRVCAGSSNTLMELYGLRLAWQNFHVPDKTSFKTSLLFDTSHQATDPRDQVFALNELMGKAFVPDYHKSTSQIYTEWAEAYVREHGDLRLLWHCGGCTPDLPSWVPDWAFRRSNATRTERSGMEYSGLFHADLNLSCPNPEPRSKGKLSAHGYTYDIVRTISKQGGIASAEDKDRLIKLCHKFVSQSRNVKDGQGITPLQLLLRTLLWDVDPLVPRWARIDAQSPINYRWALAFLKLVLSSEESELETQVSKLGLQRGEQFAASFSESFFPNLDRLSNEAFSSMWDSNLEALFHFGNKAMLNLKCFRFFLTSERRLGMCLPETRNNDIVCVLKGSEYPIILRRSSEGYINVGKCFVFGMMDGEMAKLVEEKRLESEEFIII